MHDARYAQSPPSEASFVASYTSVSRSCTHSEISPLLPLSHPANLPLHAPYVIPCKEPEGQFEEGSVIEDPTLVQECHQLMAIAGPLFVEGVAAIGEQLVSTSCVGHLPDPAALSALVLAQAVFNVSGYSIVSGLASALETLCGQAYGAGNYPLLAVMLVRAQLVCLLAIVPTVLLWSSGSLAQLLPRMGQETEIAVPTSSLLQLMVPSLLLSVVSETVAQYLLSQGLALPGMVCSLIGLGLSPLYNWGLVYWLGFGLQGAALAAVAIQGTLVVLLLTYLVYRESACCSGQSSPNWHSFRLWAALQGWISYLSYGLPCVMMVCLEWWVWEVLVLMAGLLEDAERAVAVMGLSTQLSLLPWMFCYSLGTATATRVAQALGAGSATRARRIFRMSCVLVLMCSVALCGAVWLARDVMVAALTKDVSIQQQLKHVLPVVVAAIICDGQVAVLSGLLRASGRQGIGAVINWASYWVVGLPVSWALGFKAGLGVMGLRVGLTTAAACQAIVLHCIAACRFSWHEEVKRAKQLAGATDEDRDDWLEQPADGAAASSPQAAANGADAVNVEVNNGGNRVDECGGADGITQPLLHYSG